MKMMMTMSRRKLFQTAVKLGCVCTMLAITGCGGARGPKVVPVKGKVTVGGSSAFKNGMVIFTPKEGTKNLGGSAGTDAQGNYVLTHTTLKSGIEPGEYNVSFSLYLMPDGSPVPEQKTRNPKTPQDLGAVQMVPVEYSRVPSQKNPITVTATGGTFDFTIPELAAPKTE